MINIDDLNLGCFLYKKFHIQLQNKKIVLLLIDSSILEIKENNELKGKLIIRKENYEFKKGNNELKIKRIK